MAYAYQSRIDEFKENFSFLKEKKIVLYGLGRRSADIIAADLHFNIVGLMDKDNVGKIIYNLPVLDVDEAEKVADVVIINTSENFWEIIYKRIEKISLPVYFCDGSKAIIKEYDCKELFNIRNQENRTVLNKIFTKLADNYDEVSGRIKIDSFELLGYCVIGPVILAFCHFLKDKCKEHKIRKLFFLARDGYFLKEDFDYFMSLQQQEYQISSVYLYASRVLAYILGLENKTDFEEWLSFSYRGTFAAYMEERFSIQCNDDLNAFEIIHIPLDLDKVKNWMVPYLSKIKDNLIIQKNNYEKYIKSQQIDTDTAYVDMGFKGTIQWKLNRMLGNKNIKGFYFAVNKDEKNKFRTIENMFSCFQRQDDLLAENSCTRKYFMLLESFLTAPHGMIRGVTDRGEMICAEEKNNQKYFKEKIAINKGIRELIWDMRKLQCEDAIQIDTYYGNIYRSMELTDDVSEIFYMDDEMIGNEQIKIFG